MLNHLRPVSSSIVLALAGVSLAGPSPAEKPASAPAGSYEAYQVAAKASLAEYQKLIPKPAGLADSEAAHRDAVAAQAIPHMKQVLANLDRMVEVNPSLERPIIATRVNQEAVLYALSDADTLAALDKKVKAGGPEGEMATNVVLRGRWYRAGTDAAKQADVVGAIEAAAKTQPKDVFLSQFVADIRPGVTDPALKSRLMDVLTSTADGNATAKAMVAQMKNVDKMQALEGKPLVLAGKTPEGKDFTTADWHGKVILVDFWAVWCGPCVAELPRVKKVYEQYHAQGLEVLGVDNDYAAASVMKYAEKNNLPWPQLFDAESAAAKKWHPLAKEFGITGIPRMFLIDKKGICRTVSARSNFEELIPKMLAE